MVLITRPINYYKSVLSVLFGTYLFANPDYSSVISAVIIACIIQAATTVQNDIADIAVDRENKVKRALARSIVKPVHALFFGYILIGISILIAAVSFNSLIHFSFIIIQLMLGWMYNWPPFRLNFKPIASIITLSFFYSGLPFLYGAATGGQAHELTTPIFITAAAWALMRFSLSVLKDFKDEYGDRKMGKRTFLLAYGKYNTIRTSLIIGLLAYLVFLVSILLNKEIKLTNLLLLSTAVYLTGQSLYSRLSLQKIGGEQLINKIKSIYNEDRVIQLLLLGAIIL